MTDNIFSDLTPTGRTPAAPMSQRVGSPPVRSIYGDNEREARDIWRHGGDPASLNQPAPGTASGTTPAVPPAGMSTPNSALGAWNTFYQSPAYQVPLAEGLKGVNTKYAAMGAIESGAAMKAINNYAAGHAASALGTYMDDLYRQEALGASSAAALAGVGQNMVSQVSANNNNAADAAANAALTHGQASAGNWNNIGSAIGTAAGAIGGAFGSSYHPANNNAVYNSGIYDGVDMSWMG